MRRTNFFIKLMTAVIFAALAIYLAYSVYDKGANSMTTAMAVRITMTDSASVSGVTVRNESVISGSGGNLLLLVSDGEKVGTGQKIAVLYNDSKTSSLAAERNRLSLEAEQIRKIMTGVKDVDPKTDVTALMRIAASGDLSQIEGAIADVSTSVSKNYTGMSQDELSKQYSQIEQEIISLDARISSSAKYLTSQSSGTFSSKTDGFESITPDDVTDLTVLGFDSMFKARTAPDNAVGRLAIGVKWKYVFKTSEETAAKLEPGKTVTISFDGAFPDEIEMTVDSVSADKGEKAVVLSANKFLQYAAAVRRIDGVIIFETSEGLRIPAEAVHTDADGAAYLYTVHGTQAKKLAVTVRSSDGTYAILEDDGSLTGEEEIIVRANDLYDGKVVRRG